MTNLRLNEETLLNDSAPCPCGSGKAYVNCCKAIIFDEQQAISAEQLMRSRYTAFVINASGYLLTTSSKQLAVNLTPQELENSYKGCTFLKLEILSTSEHQVEFIAHYLIKNSWYQLHEKSSFIFEAGAWKYDSGVLYPTAEVKLGRNDSCPCGSGKKFKKCHG